MASTSLTLNVMLTEVRREDAVKELVREVVVASNEEGVEEPVREVVENKEDVVMRASSIVRLRLADQLITRDQRPLRLLLMVGPDEQDIGMPLARDVCCQPIEKQGDDDDEPWKSRSTTMTRVCEREARGM